MIGLLTDEAGSPLAVRVFEGNTADPTTVPTPLTMLQERLRVATRKIKVVASPRFQPKAGLQALHTRVKRYKLSHIVALGLAERQFTLRINTAAHEQALQLAGCSVLETDVPAELLETQTAHDRSKALACVEQDLCTLKTGLLEVRPVFVRKDTRTRGHVLVGLLALQLSRELQQRLAVTDGTTKDDPHGVTLQDALDTLHRLCLLTYPLDDTHRITRLPRPDDQQPRLLQAGQVPLPSRVAERQENCRSSSATTHVSLRRELEKLHLNSGENESELQAVGGAYRNGDKNQESQWIPRSTDGTVVLSLQHHNNVFTSCEGSRARSPYMS